jgi:glycopeptide antibiotics resistance protein
MLKFTDGQLTLIPGLVVLIPALPIAAWIWRKHADREWTLMALLALFHVTLAIGFTIFPIPIGGQDYYRRTRGLSEDNFVPFATIVHQIRGFGFDSLRQLSGNFVALMPLGVYGPYLWPALRDWRRFALVAVVFAVSIEAAQYVGSWIEGFTYRVTDVDDAIMNASGAMLAFLLWPKAWSWLKRRLLAARLLQGAERGSAG